MLCSCSQRENNLEFIDFASVISFKGKMAFILQIKDDVYSSSASLQMSWVMLNSEVKSSYGVELFKNYSRLMLEQWHALTIEPLM